MLWLYLLWPFLFILGVLLMALWVVLYPFHREMIDVLAWAVSKL